MQPPGPGPDELPAAARAVLARWHALRDEGGLPDLRDLAPGTIPADMLPWTMTLKRDAAREIVYGVVGEALAAIHGANPRGRPFLYHSDNEEAWARLRTVHRALDTGTPFWVVSKGLLGGFPAMFGRLALPARTGAGDVLLILVFKFPQTAPAGDPIWLVDPPG
jgi:hypothetical protein